MIHGAQHTIRFLILNIRSARGTLLHNGQLPKTETRGIPRLRASAVQLWFRSRSVIQTLLNREKKSKEMVSILFVARTGWNDSTLATGVTWKTAQLSFADILTDTDQFADFPRCGNKTGVT